MTSEPPVDPSAERRLHPAHVLARALAATRALVPAFAAPALWGTWGAVALGVLLVGVAVALVLEWQTTRYAVVDGALRLRSGILRRSERVVPASRISALDTTRGIVQRAFGLVALEVQTAGGDEQAELRLDAVTTEEAERVRALLGHAGQGAPGVVPGGDGAGDAAAREGAGEGASEGASDAPVPGSALGPAPGAPADAQGAPVASAAPHAAPAVPANPPVYAISGRELLVAALTGPQIGVVFVLVASALSQAGELLPDTLVGQVRRTLTTADLATLVALAAIGLLLAAVLSVVGTVLAFAEFTVVRDDRRLRVRRGLLTERTGTIPLDRIQGVRVVEGLLRRPLGYATVQVEVAGYRTGTDVTRTLVPLVHRRELPALLDRVLPELAWPADALHAPPAAARRRYWALPLAASVVPAVAALLLLPDAWRALAVMPPLAAVALGDAAWRGAGWLLTGEVLAVRHQLLARTTLLALPRRVQRVAVRTTPLGRRAGLATFDVVLATGRHGTARYIDAATAEDLQRAVAARTAAGPRAVALRDLPLDFAAAPPE